MSIAGKHSLLKWSVVYHSTASRSNAVHFFLHSKQKNTNMLYLLPAAIHSGTNILYDRDLIELIALQQLPANVESV